MRTVSIGQLGSLAAGSTIAGYPAGTTDETMQELYDLLWRVSRADWQALYNTSANSLAWINEAGNKQELVVPGTDPWETFATIKRWYYYAKDRVARGETMQKTPWIAPLPASPFDQWGRPVTSAAASTSVTVPAATLPSGQAPLSLTAQGGMATWLPPEPASGLTQGQKIALGAGAAGVALLAIFLARR